jgi:hypothetical protein
LRHVDETRHSLEALADLTGAKTGKLQAQVNGLKAQLDELRGEVNLLRALLRNHRPKNGAVNEKRLASLLILSRLAIVKRLRLRRTPSRLRKR